MKTFKQFLLLQETSLQPPPPEGFEYVSPPRKRRNTPEQTPQDKTGGAIITNPVSSGTYKITPMQALINRLGSREAALEYIKQIRERRAKYGANLNPDWVLPSVDDADLNAQIGVSIDTTTKQKDPSEPILGKTNYRPIVSVTTNAIKKINTGPSPITILANPTGMYDPERRNNFINQTLGIESELKNNQRTRRQHYSPDTLWHEIQHVLQFPTLLGKDYDKIQSGGNYNVGKTYPQIAQDYAEYVTSAMELPAFASELKSRFRDYTNNTLDLGPNMSADTLNKLRAFLKNSNRAEDIIMHNALTDPKTSKQFEELLRQLAKKDSRDTEIYTA